MKIKVDNFEVRVLINGLSELRNKLLSENEDTEIVNDMILKYLDYLEKCKWLNLKLVNLAFLFCLNLI